jgi:hypothetical protein
MTTNRVASLHRQAWATHTRTTRERWFWIAQEAKIPGLKTIGVEVTPLHSSNRSPQDAGACAPEAKAAIDGLVDAGIILDDSGDHLPWIMFNRPEIGTLDGLRLTVLDLT